MRKQHSANLAFAFEEGHSIPKVAQKHGQSGRENAIEGEIPATLTPKNGDRFLFISKSQRIHTHAIHKYPAKFFPELPNWLIRKYSKKGERVLDPFMGSGTTNVEALLLGRHSDGVDVDPFSRMLARVKTTPLPGRALETAACYLVKKMAGYTPSSPLEDVPLFPYREHWFKPHVLHELAYIKAQVEALRATQKIKDFMRIVFSSIIRAVSEADDQCTRTVIRKNRPKNIQPSKAIGLFLRRLQQQVTGMEHFSKHAPPNIQVTIPHNASADNLCTCADASIDLAVTSPPYLNAVDYPRTHQLEMYWLGLAEGSLRDLKRQHVGTEIVYAKDYQHLHTSGYARADAVIAHIYQKDPRRAYIAYKYLMDMQANLKEVYRVLKPKARYLIAIGNNRIRGHTFESWKYLLDMAQALGYQVNYRFESEIINHFIKLPRAERIDEDHVLVLQK